MRKLSITLLALSIVLPLSSYTVLAAQSTEQAVDINGTLQFTSILGGSVYGPAYVSGTISSAGELSSLKGTANLPLKDEKLLVAPTSTILITTERLNVYWYRYVCDPVLGCVYQQGTSIFERRYGQGPVDIRLGSLHGNGTLSMSTTATCFEACPPPGSNWWVPYAYAQISGGVTSSQDAGNVNINGTPVIH